MQQALGNQAVGRMVQAKLNINQPGDEYEQEADRVADTVMRMPGPRSDGHRLAITPLTSHGAQRKCAECEEEKDEGALQRKESGSAVTAPATAPPIVNKALSSPGQPLDTATRAFFEPRFGHDFSGVRVHTDAQAAESTGKVSALAYTIGKHIAFAPGQYSPTTPGGQRLLAHELVHVAQQERGPEPALQRFTASLGDGNKVMISPEQGDTDQDLDRVLCPAISDRKIAGRQNIDVTGCLPTSSVKAMGLGPYNCAEFVRFSLGEAIPASGRTSDWLTTSKLWEELLKKGYTIRGFGVVKENGNLETAQGLSWWQQAPRMGDIVFMNGEIKVFKGTEPSSKGDNFTVNWDHVGIFIVRSRSGFDYHFAKDGDENPVGIYHTGSAPAKETSEGAYVRGGEKLAAYLGPPAATTTPPPNETPSPTPQPSGTPSPTPHPN
jgi:hypothetical protein